MYLRTKCSDPLLKELLEDPLHKKPSLEQAIAISKKYSVALHPKYTYYWNELSSNKLLEFFLLFQKIKENETGYEIPYSLTKTLGLLGVPHTIKKLPIEKTSQENQGKVCVLSKQTLLTLLTNIGVDISSYSFDTIITKCESYITKIKEELSKSALEIINESNTIEIRDKGGTYIGARMGRPEKAKMRKQFNSETKSHALFPVGEKGGRTKNIIDIFKTSGEIEEAFRIYYDEDTNEETIYPYSLTTKKKTKNKYFEKYTYRELKEKEEGAIQYKKTTININPYEKEVREILGTSIQYPKHVKGITETINKHHTVEHLCKGILRAHHNLYVNKDGTVRYDMIEMGLTHFKPLEIGTSIEKLKELGYTKDYLGNPLERDDQILEIFPQDVILPDCPTSGEELASDFILQVGNFVDDLLEKFYKLPRFYNFKSKEDTIGHLIIGLAPHTSAGIIGRIIGYSKTQGCFSHPVWHAAQRRNLDGDENGIMLLMDGLINFSREFLPDRRGSRSMDVSLVLTSHLYLDQIDDEVHGMDIVDHYPLEFYKACKEFKSPKEVKIEKLGQRVDANDINKKYRGYYFTHDTTNMNDTILCSAYKFVPSMKEKLDLQLEIGKKIRAVEEDKVASLIIDKHFMKDIKGNLRKFGQQQFRCTNCNTKYRRPPLIGKCTHCNMPSINFTISEGSVKKYVQHSFNIIEEFSVDPYIVEVLRLTQIRLDGVFGKELEKQKNLSQFFK
jgi:DNA polymerase II large subunit